jgi:hypothetical protein
MKMFGRWPAAGSLSSGEEDRTTDAVLLAIHHFGVKKIDRYYSVKGGPHGQKQ